MPGLADFVTLAKEFGIFEFYLPFVIMFAIFYGLLSKSHVFGDPTKSKSIRNINAVVSFAAALYLMAFTPIGLTLTQFFAQFFAGTIAILITLLVFGMIVWMFLPLTGQEKPNFPGALKYLAVFGGLLALGLLISSGGLNVLFPGGLAQVQIPAIGLSTEDLFFIGMLILTLLIFWLLIRGEGKGKEGEKVKYVGVPIRE